MSPRGLGGSVAWTWCSTCTCARRISSLRGAELRQDHSQRTVLCQLAISITLSVVNMNKPAQLVVGEIFVRQPRAALLTIGWLCYTDRSAAESELDMLLIDRSQLPFLDFNARICRRFWTSDSGYLGTGGSFKKVAMGLLLTANSASHNENAAHARRY